MDIQTGGEPQMLDADLQAQIGAQGDQTVDQMQQQKQQQQQAQEQKAEIMNSILSTEAQQRLGRIAVVNKEKVERVEMMLIQMAQKGQIREKVSEAKIVQMLEQVADMDSKVTVTTIRSGGGGPSPFDDDEEDPIAKAMAMGARIPGQDDSSDDY